MSRGPINIEMPDQVSYEQVKQALALLGFDRNQVARLELGGRNLQTLTVETTGLDFVVVRTYQVDGYSVRIAPREDSAA